MKSNRKLIAIALLAACAFAQAEVLVVRVTKTPELQPEGAGAYVVTNKGYLDLSAEQQPGAFFVEEANPVVKRGDCIQLTTKETARVSFNAKWPKVSNVNNVQKVSCPVDLAR